MSISRVRTILGVGAMAVAMPLNAGETTGSSEASPRVRYFVLAADVGFGHTASSLQAGWGPSWSLQVGIGRSRRKALVLEYVVEHTNDERPAPSDLVVLGGEIWRIETLRTPRVLETRYLLLSLQVQLARGFYVRPGVGFAGNRFASYAVDPHTGVTSADLSEEGGPAIGLAVGYVRALGPHLDARAELALRGARGEDSTSPRQTASARVGATWWF